MYTMFINTFNKGEVFPQGCGKLYVYV